MEVLQTLVLSVGGRSADTMAARARPHGWTLAAFDAPVDSGPVSLRAISKPDAPVLARNGLAGILALGEDRAVITGLPLRLDRNSVADGRALARALTRCDGIFSAVIWLAAESRVLIITDFLGNDPLYWQISDGRAEVSSTARVFDWTPDPAGWGAFIRMGHMVGDGTLVSGVRRLDAAQVIEIDARTAKVISTRTYWQPPLTEGHASIADIVGHMRTNVADYGKAAGETCILLSGGVDSRIILACAAAEGLRPHAHIVEHREEAGDADGKLALAAARIAGVPATFHNPRPGFFSSATYLDYLTAMEGAFPTLDLFIAQVLQFVPAPAVWEGQLPNVTLRAIHPAGGFAAYDMAKLKPADCPEMATASQLFAPAFAEQLNEAFEAQLASSRLDIPDDDFGVGHWVTINRMRRRAGYNAYKVYPHKAATMAAGASQDFWQAVMSLPLAGRQHYALCWDMLEQHFPDYARLPFISGGQLVAAPSGAPALPKWQRKRALFEWMSRHPSIGVRLGQVTRAEPPSHFLAAPALFEQDDPALDPQTLNMLAQSAPDAHLPLKYLLFHWRAAQWVHQGRLHDQLGANPNAKAHTP